MEEAISRDNDSVSQLWCEINGRKFDYDSARERVGEKYRLVLELYQWEILCEVAKDIERGLTLEEYLVLKVRKPLHKSKWHVSWRPKPT